MIQIDIPMPSNCMDCPCCYDGCDCNVESRNFTDEERGIICNQRVEWCPLKEC